MLSAYSADLHIHTCLSPCGELEMSPLRVAERAASVGLDMIAICDHNSAENAGAVMKAAGQGKVTVIAGMEITTSEEVHVLGLFPTLRSALAAQEVVFEHLEGENDEEAFGMQVIADERDEVVGFNTRLLIGATDLDYSKVVALIRKHGGLAIASHVDRDGFGLIGRLGFIPEEPPLDAAELSCDGSADQVTESCLGSKPPMLIRSSDAHRLDEIGEGRCLLLAAEASFDELRSALHGEGGRRVDI